MEKTLHSLPLIPLKGLEGKGRTKEISKRILNNPKMKSSKNNSDQSDFQNFNMKVKNILEK